MLMRALRERNLALLGLAMDLMVPPLSLLANFLPAEIGPRLLKNAITRRGGQGPRCHVG
jgi:hypothetical protein